MKRLAANVFSMIFLGIFAFTAASQAADTDVLAKIKGKNITTKDFNDFITTFPADKKKFIEENPQQKETLFKRMVQVKALAETARQKGLDKDPKISIMLDYYTSEILSQEYIKAEIARIEITDSDLKQYYKVNEASFKTPEMIKARHILVKIENAPTDVEKMLAKAKAKEKADAVLARVKAGENFEKLAAELSDDPGSKTKGGDLGFFAKGKMVPQFEEKAFSMKPGEVSDLVESKFGYHIIKVEEKKEAGLEPFEKVKDKAKEMYLNSIKKDKQQEIVEKAMKDAGVEMDLDLLKAGKK